MSPSKKINRLAKRLIAVATVNGELDESSLGQAITRMKERGFKQLLPLLKVLRFKVARAVARQTLEVTSSNPLSEGALAKLEKEFTQKYQRRLRLKTVIDPSMIGGLQVRIGDDVYDASLMAQLNRLANEV
ncbi:MAG: ATP synthase F1 subunit delta [Puniceicoccaceae bacterium]|nr:ATP synthase F1 subunit delta [Puniceicoccaceae bacterium]